MPDWFMIADPGLRFRLNSLALQLGLLSLRYRLWEGSGSIAHILRSWQYEAD